MASAKLVQISKDIDAARLLEQTILAEASLSQLCQSARQQQQQTIDYQEKALRMATLEARLDPEQVRSIQQQLRNVIQLPDQDDTFALQKEFAIIVLTRSHFECGEYEQAIELVNKLSFTKDQVSQGYGLVLFLQARIIKGTVIGHYSLY
ncbi:hypothetical protein RMATCC62417_04178 [Rhizopus microsporus]|nr:hypothetical protein RMATCC62417_04178 [Rhizopus microsporus]